MKTWIKWLFVVAGLVLQGNGLWNAAQTNANASLTEEQRAGQWAKYGALPILGGGILAAAPAMAGSVMSLGASASKAGGSLVTRAKQALSGLAIAGSSDPEPLLAEHSIIVDGAQITIRYDEAKLSGKEIRSKIVFAVAAALEVRTGDHAQ